MCRLFFFAMGGRRMDIYVGLAYITLKGREYGVAMSTGYARPQAPSRRVAAVHVVCEGACSSRRL